MPSTGCSRLLDGVLTLCDFASRNLNGDGVLVERMLRDGTREYLPVTFNLGVARAVNLRPPRAWPYDAPLAVVEFPGGEEWLLQEYGVMEIIELDLSLQNPPKLGKATPTQQLKFNEAFSELWKRLHANDGKNPCAELFGGIKKAEEALRNTNFVIGSTRHPSAWAETEGKNVTLATDPFFAERGESLVSVQVGSDLRRQQVFNVALSSVEAGAFILLHELGHRTGRLRPDGHDQMNFVTVLNNGRVRDACFADIPRTVSPLP
jgi:hypothetical protein